MARHLYRQRTLRARHFPHSLFAEPVWDMLLDLFVNDCDRRRQTVKSVCIAARVPTTTALRHLNWLIDEGLAVRLPHPSDSRSVHVCLSETGFAAMSSYLEALRSG